MTQEKWLIRIVLWIALQLTFGGPGAMAQDPTVSQSETNAAIHRVQTLIPFVIHQPVRTPDGAIAAGVDGFGHLVDGNQQPLFDTLIGIANPTADAINVRFMFFDQQGNSQLWGDHRVYRDYLLKPGCSLATTLIPNNVFPDPPQSFVGYAILELSSQNPVGDVPALPVYALIGGGGFYPDHWNTFSASLPVYRAPLLPKTQWLFPYLIPYFEDANHSGSLSYRTGMVITNFGTEPVHLKLTYRVGDVYPKAGKQLALELNIGASQSVCLDLYDALVRAGYPAGMNSEGWLAVDSDTPASIVPYLVLANRSYKGFSAGQGPGANRE